ncbi:apolipoprotein N-acyltransferase [Streptomyces sp. NA04227]|uniref:apolipoprotein N-acyltransferase n=1 Tax=Streptomyces sp. NA04227 TaxID=2742136 RepID=UPI00158FFDB0|nr:apolipoprotein N-acyltransferase [Streptomyces sp. NA04227]QKW05363.1 apolipoprotein N-acyltransferase [Streptomyces sp. NA04227]
MDLLAEDSGSRRTSGRDAPLPRGIRFRRDAAALFAGALPALTFPAPALWWLAPFVLVPWLLLLASAPTPRRASWEGWLGGLGFMLAVHHWLLPSLHVFTLVVAGLLGLLWAPWGRLVHHLTGRDPSPGRACAALVLVPSGWLLIELVRSWEGLGGPWGLLGSSQWQVPAALRLASLGGVWLVSLLLVMVNTALALLFSVRVPAVRAPAAPVSGVRLLSVHARSRPVPVRARGWPALAALAAVAVGTTAAWAFAPRPDPAGTTRAAVVQPGVIGGSGSGDARFAREEALTRGLAGRDVDLVVWGESSVGFDLSERPDLAVRIARLARLVDADVLVNVDARRSESGTAAGIHKSSVLVGPEGPTGDRYDKMRLVPFGEYVPLRSLLGWATSVGRAAGEDRLRGTEQEVMRTDGGPRVGTLICFESAFPDMSRHLAADGAQLLLAQSSTSSFQGSWAPRQHASLAAMRAAETGRPMMHATLTGVSAVYGPDGRRVGEPLGTSASAARVYEVPLATGVTPYVRFGDWPVYGSVAAVAVFLLVEGVRRVGRGERRHGT